jgi:hypothetical protein
VTYRRIQRWLSPGVEFADDPAVRLCAKCGYPFPGGRDGAPAACTECGTYIDPARFGYLQPASPPEVIRRLLRAPGLKHAFVFMACVALVATGSVAPGGYWGVELAGIGFLIGAWLAWLFRAAVAAVAALRVGRFKDTFRQRGWWVTATSGTILVLAAASPLPMYAVFRLERGRLDAVAAAWTAAPDQRPTVDFLLLPGTSTVDVSLVEGRTDVSAVAPAGWRDGGFGLAIPRTGFIFETGVYYYLPNLPPGSAPVRALQHLGGPWFAGEHSW